MIKQFYEKLLPQQGVYCIGELDKSKPIDRNFRHLFANNIEELYEKIEQVKARKHDVYVSMGTFSRYSRMAKDCIYHKSFFIDFDVGDLKALEGKGYYSQQDALDALEGFVKQHDLPPPIRVNSGIGIHAYWIFDEVIEAKDFLPYAQKFKALCIKSGLTIDTGATPADLARVMRWVGSYNYRSDPPAQCQFIDEEFNEYSFDAFKEFLDSQDLQISNRKADPILSKARKGLDEETLAITKADNWEYLFNKIVTRSLEGDGCEQIKHIIINSKTAGYVEWTAGLRLAAHCDDHAEAIHLMSEDYEGYDREQTIKTAYSFDEPPVCKFFEEEISSERCRDCKFRGKIHTPISLGKSLKIATSDTKESVREEPDTEEVPTPKSLEELGKEFPEFLQPFVRGSTGGVYYVSPPVTDKDGKKHQDDPIMVCPYDFYPISRMFSPSDGECMKMRLELPNDAVREFIIPMKFLYAKDKFREIVSYHGVTPSPKAMELLNNYVIRWQQYMIGAQKASIMRTQMGWTEDNTSFVVGENEILKNGEVIPAPISSNCKSVSKWLHAEGSFEEWRTAANKLNLPGFEYHAFIMLCGFASPLMRYTTTPGVSVSLTGKSGAAKTGALYGALSVFGKPEPLSVLDATENGMVGRYLTLHSLILGMDEVSNKHGKVLADLIHKISQGKAKIRMQGSINAEREHERSASLICVFTTNESVYSKLEAFKGNPRGEAARLVEFLMPQPELLRGDQGGTLGSEIFNTFNFHYGHAGPKFIDALFRLGDGRVDEYRMIWENRFIKDFGNPSEYRFYKNLMAVVFAAGQINNEEGILDFDLERIYMKILKGMVAIRDDVVKVNAIDYESMLGDFANKYIQNILVMRNSALIREPRGALMARVDVDKDLMQVSKSEFKKYLNDNNVSAREFELEMKERGILLDIKKARLASGWKGAVQSDPAVLYWFKHDSTASLMGEGEEVEDDDA